MVGILLAGQIEKGQNIITEYMLQSLYDVISDSVILTTLKTKLNKMLNANIINIPCLETWDRFIIDCDNFINENNLKSIIVVKPTMMRGFRRGDRSHLDRIIEKVASGEFKDKEGLGYMTTKSILNRFMFIELASKKCNIIHYCFDPNEIVFNNSKRLGLLNDEMTKYIPCYEPMMVEKGYSRDKGIDFSFYCTAITQEREWIANKKEVLEDGSHFECKSNIKIITRKSKNYELKQNDYYDLLSKSRYTLIIPSYDQKSFSIIRFIEAISHDCLPFVLDRCCLDSLRLTFPEIAEIVYSKLIVHNFKELDKIIMQTKENKRIDTINEIKYTKD